MQCEGLGAQAMTLRLRGVLLCALLTMPMQAHEPLGHLSTEPKREPIRLASLRSECSLGKEWVGSVYQLPWGAWLECGGESMLVTHPLNLLGKVNIRTPDQALEFVRLFSSGETYAMFDLEGMLEIRPETAKEDWGQNVMKMFKLDKGYEKPSVEVHTQKVPCLGEEARGEECSSKVFSIKRLVVFYDQNIYQITESLREDGFYLEVDRKIVVEDIERFGLMHQGPC